jgi:hypothetical protein
MLGGPQSRSGHGMGREKFLAGTRTPDHPARITALYHWAIPARTIHLHRSLLVLTRAGTAQSVQRLGYWLAGWLAGWTIGVWFPAVRNFSLRHRVQTGSEAHPASYLMDTGVKRLGREAGHSAPSSADVMNTSNPPYAFMAWRLVIISTVTAPDKENRTYRETNLSHFHFVHHKSLTGLYLRLCRKKQRSNCPECPARSHIPLLTHGYK